MVSTSALLLSALAGAQAGIFGGSDGAFELTNANFESEVKTSGKNAFVKFLAPW
jgi:hypothetical protein